MPHLYFNIYKFVFLAFLLTATACNVDKNKKVDTQNIQFETTDNSVLFFKNLRQSYYDKQENTVAKVDIYRYQKRNQAQNQPVINLAIVHHWRNDKAFVMIEPSELLNQEARLEVSWQDTVKQTKGKYIFDFGDMELHYQFATSLYTSIQAKYALQIKSAGQWIDLMPTEDEKETFRKVMLDYLRLVNAVK